MDKSETESVRTDLNKMWACWPGPHVRKFAVVYGTGFRCTAEKVKECFGGTLRLHIKPEWCAPSAPGRNDLYIVLSESTVRPEQRQHWGRAFDQAPGIDLRRGLEDVVVTMDHDLSSGARPVLRLLRQDANESGPRLLLPYQPLDGFARAEHQRGGHVGQAKRRQPTGDDRTGGIVDWSRRTSSLILRWLSVLSSIEVAWSSSPAMLLASRRNGKLGLCELSDP